MRLPENDFPTRMKNKPMYQRGLYLGLTHVPIAIATNPRMEVKRKSAQSQQRLVQCATF